MQESLSSEHSSKLFRDTFEDLLQTNGFEKWSKVVEMKLQESETYLDGGVVTNECGRHLKTSGWDVTNSGLDVVGNPFNKVAAILILNIQHLIIDFLHGHTSTEHGSNSEVTTMTWITCSHHVFGIKHLLSEFRNSESTVLLGATTCEWGKSRHEEVKTREWNHIDSQFTQVSVQLT